MSKFTNDEKGIMGLTLSQIGLIVATGVILAAVFSLIFLNDWQRNAELKNIANVFSTLVEGAETKFFEETTVFNFPKKDYDYNVSISSEYIVVSAKGKFGNEIFCKERFLIKPWPQKKNSPWFGRIGLHNYLKENFGNSGNVSDPIKKIYIDDVKNYFKDEMENLNKSFALSPFYILRNKTVYIENAFVYYDNNDNNFWDDADEKQVFIFVYQK
ncbi:MAG: hypothetical protein QHH19_00495 [Candidatus Thermoplasmatota archaeon]|nr:hypothetical protein [Candidatus Thermoplasmatota archaeon]